MRFRAASVSKSKMKSHFFNLPLRFATALCLLLLAAAHPTFGAVTFSGDAYNDGTSVFVGNTGQGSLTIDDGSSLSNTFGEVGNLAGSTGTVNVSGGTWANSGNLTVGRNGNGTLNLTGNGAVSVGGLVSLANTSGKTGTLNLGNGTAAGTFSAATITGGNGTAVVNINQSGSYTLGSNMTGSLALNHTGTGISTLTGTNTYTGNTTVSAGTANAAAAAPPTGTR
jgi:autotransporter family porin